MPTLPPASRPDAAKPAAPAAAAPRTAVVRLPRLTAPVDEAALDASVTFTWTPAAGADAYELVVSETPDFSDAVCSVRTSEPSATVFDAFEPDRTYWWRVRHRDARGRWSIRTPAASFRTVPSAIPGRRMRGATVPTPLGPVAGAPVDAASLALSWTPVDGAEAYQVQIARDPHFERLDLDLPLGPAAALTLVKMLPDPSARYVWRVRARSAGTWTEWSAPATFRAATDDEADAHAERHAAARAESERQRAREALAAAAHVAEANPPHRTHGTSAIEAFSFIVAILVGFGVMIGLVLWAAAQ